MFINTQRKSESTEGFEDVTSSLKTESQNRREERLAERAVKGTDFRAEDEDGKRAGTNDRDREKQGQVRDTDGKSEQSSEDPDMSCKQCVCVCVVPVMMSSMAPSFPSLTRGDTCLLFSSAIRSI